MVHEEMIGDSGQERGGSPGIGGKNADDDEQQVEDPHHNDDCWQAALNGETRRKRSRKKNEKKKSTFAVKQLQVLFSGCCNKNSDYTMLMLMMMLHFAPHSDVRFLDSAFHVYIHTSCNVANYPSNM